jgi:penicillin-binding protein 1A
MVGVTEDDKLGLPGKLPGKTPRPASRKTAGNPRGKRPHWGLRLIGRIFGTLLALGILGGVIGGFTAWRLYVRYSDGLPSLDTLRNYQPEVMSRVYAGNSQLISELATERRIYVPLSAIPTVVQQAFISAENRNYWTDPGIDPEAMIRAGVTDLMHYGRRRPIGASTITQQVARNMLLDDSPTISRKARELILAVRIQQSMTKQQILELYLNEINLGLSSYGVAAASQAYFNKSLDDLTLPDAAFLAVLPKAPAHYNPFRFPEKAKDRRDWVLDQMADDDAITQAQADAAKATPINAAPFRRPDAVVGADWFAEEVRRQLVNTYGNDVLTGGYIVRTSLNPDLQAYADHALHDGMVAYDRKHGGWRGPVSQIQTGPLFASSWVTSLSGMARPPGMLTNWVLATVLDETDAQATLGYIYVPAGALPSAGTAQMETLALADVKWARRAGKTGALGPVPKKMSDVLAPGDVVMVEAVPDAGSGKTLVAAHVELRQIPKVEGALISLDPSTGRVLALVGGWSFAQSQFDRATQAQRQPGSSFKPFVYLTALEKGISPSQQFLDAPIVIDMGAGQPQYRPNNFEMTFNGPTPLRVALEQSLNLVTIRVAETVGLDAVAKTAVDFGVVDKMPLVPSAAIGAIETTVLRQAGAYASLAAGGKRVTPILIDSVQDRMGRIISRPTGIACDNCSDPNQQPVITDQRAQIADPQSVYQLTGMMEGVVTRGTGTLAGAGMTDREIAGKTGTTEDFNDAWFGGFTPDLVTMVWVGFDNPASLGEKETGGSIAAPIWHDYMIQALKTRPKLQFPMPMGLTLADWDSGTGIVADAFKPGQVPGASNDDLQLANASAVDQNGKPVAAAPGGGAPDAATPAGTTAAPTAPAAANPNSIDKSLGNLY